MEKLEMKPYLYNYGKITQYNIKRKTMITHRVYLGRIVYIICHMGKDKKRIVRNCIDGVYCCFMFAWSYHMRHLTKKEAKDFFKKLLIANYKRACEKHPVFPTDLNDIYFLFDEELGEHSKAINDNASDHDKIAEIIDVATLFVRCIDNIEELK